MALEKVTPLSQNETGDCVELPALRKPMLVAALLYDR